MMNNLHNVVGRDPFGVPYQQTKDLGPRIFEQRLNAPKPKRAPSFTCIRLEVVDEAKLRAIDDGLDASLVLRLSCPWLEPVDVPSAGVRCVPTDTVDGALDVPRALYRAIVDDVGSERQPSDDRWLAEAQRFAAECMACKPSDPFEPFSGREAAFAEQVADAVCGSYGVDARHLADVLGREVGLPTKSLWSGQHASRLADTARARVEAAEAAKAEAERVAAEAVRMPTLAEVQAVGVEIVNLPWTAGFEWGLPFYQDDHRRVYVWAGYRGIELPEGHEEMGLRIMRSDELMPRKAPPPEMSVGALHFTRWLRARVGRFDAGTIDAARYSDRGIERAEELAVAFAPTLLHPHMGYMRPLIAEFLVRGLLVRPDRAEKILRLAQHAEYVRRSPQAERLITKEELARAGEPAPVIETIDNPTSPEAIEKEKASFLAAPKKKIGQGPPDAPREVDGDLARLCMLAASGAGPATVAPGALLDAELAPIPLRQTKQNKRGKS